MNIVVCHGGGLDSLAALYYQLKHTDDEIFVMHLLTFNFKSPKHEQQYFQMQIDWLLNNVRKFEYKIYYAPKSEIFKGKQDMRFMRKVIQIMNEKPKYDRIMSGRCLVDVDTSGDIWNDSSGVLFEEKTGKKYLEQRVRSYFFDKTKEDEFNFLPAELQQMIWTCHVPISNLQCGTCSKCTELKDNNILDRLNNVYRNS